MKCAVVAVPSELGEDEVKAVIVLRDGARASPEDLWAFCDEHMPRFWVPRYIAFMHQMPKTPSQKIQKYMLRAGEVRSEMFDRAQTHREPRS